MRDRLISPPWSLQATRLSVIPNWADCQEIQPQPVNTNELRRQQGLSERFVVMHSGNMGLTQRLEVLIDATTSPYWPPRAVLLLIGDGAARSQLQAQAARCGSQRVRFLPYQPRSGLSTSLSAADLHVISMHERITGCLCPSKLYGILAAGRPVLAIADQATDLVRTVREHRLGWCCEPGNAQEIAKAVAAAEADSEQRISAGRRARELACERFDRPIAHEQFKKLLIGVLQEGSEFLGDENCDNLQKQPAG